MNKHIPTVKQLLDEAEQHLRAAGIDEPKLSSKTIIAAAIACPRLELYLRLEDPLSLRRLEIIRKGIRRLAAGEPLQYVLGTAEFMGYAFKCDRRALIPRPETEELVEMVCAYEPLWRTESPAIIDIGTGSGCIIISLALLKRKGCYWAIDISGDAIKLACENAAAHKVTGAIKFIRADLHSGSLPVGIDAVVANPPYVRSADFNRLDKHVRLWEPRLALDGGKDGLRIIRPLIKKAFQILKPGRWLFMEIGAGQWPAVERLVFSAGFRQCTLKRDQAGHARMVIAVK